MIIMAPFYAHSPLLIWNPVDQPDIDVGLQVWVSYYLTLFKFSKYFFNDFIIMFCWCDKLMRVSNSLFIARCQCFMWLSWVSEIICSFPILCGCLNILAMLIPQINKIRFADNVQIYRNQVCYRQGIEGGALGRQSERNFAYDWLALTSIFGLCLMSVCLLELNCYSFLYFS